MPRRGGLLAPTPRGRTISDQNPQEVTSLNADELDMEDLEDVAGGLAAGTCGTFTCGTYTELPPPPNEA